MEIAIGETVGIAASMGLQNLQHEPQRLHSEAERLNTELESLVMDNYRVFVENLTCSVHLRTEVS
jgi:Dor1-like family